MTKQEAIQKGADENSGYMLCLNDLMKYINQVKNDCGTPPTAKETWDFFIIPKIEERAKKVEQLIRESA